MNKINITGYIIGGNLSLISGLTYSVTNNLDYILIGVIGYAICMISGIFQLEESEPPNANL